MNTSNPAITSQATLAGFPPLLRITFSSRYRGLDRDRVFRPPSDDHLPPDLLERLCGGGLEVLADDLKLSTGVEATR